jgi:hypothetical protein
MSESTNMHGRRMKLHLQLLATVSFAALLGGSHAGAADADHPIVWLELDGQYARQNAGDVAFVPPFVVNSPFPALPQLDGENASSVNWEEGGRISYTPTGSDWFLQASLRFGKSSGRLRQDQVTAHPSPYYNKYHAYQNVRMYGSESHTILDFKAGKDVGLGSFGNNGGSTFSFGIRYAQFNSRSAAHFQSQPSNLPQQYGSHHFTIHRFYADFAAQRKFAGIGPSLSWDASATLAGSPSANADIALDWGINGALLFGRQRTQVEHQTSENFHTYATSGQYVQHYRHAASPDRSRKVAVPNLGGFAAVSWRYADAKVSLGYRADYFFGAIDGGLATAKKEDRGFYGPFASISIGIGD